MGRYYALADGEPAVVADAIQSHYQPRFNGDTLPQGHVACAVALADKLDALIGFFGIGQIPTGDKDPFGLRRAALGVLRILMETPLALSLPDLIDDAAAGFAPELFSGNWRAASADFFKERLRHMLRDAGHDPKAVDAVLALDPTRIDQVPAKLAAVKAFAALPEAEALAAANKRVGNILKKVEGAVAPGFDNSLLQEAAERALAAMLPVVKADAEAAFARGDYTASLQALAKLRTPVDAFFNDVMVNAEDPALRANRLGLLATLHNAMNRVADISKLSS
jgi:glycyl-tRNA synthetase beta chain